MIPANWLLLAVGGLVAGILAGFLGIGGGTVLVPVLVTLRYTPIQAVATSSLAITITAISGSVQNWRMGYFSLKRVVFLGFPALITAQIGVYLANRIASSVLLIAFGILLLVNIYLVELRKRLTSGKKRSQQPQRFNAIISKIDEAKTALQFAGLFCVVGGGIIVLLQILLFGELIQVAIQTSLGVIIITPVLLIVLGILLLVIIYLVELFKLWKTRNERTQQQLQKFNVVLARIATGGAAGILAGLFGVGGGVIMVPLQILLLGEPIKVAIQTSLGVIIITAISASIGHALSGNVLFVEGIILGCGGLLGAQISTRYLPKLPDQVVSLAFRTMLAILSVYMFWQAWQSYES